MRMCVCVYLCVCVCVCVSVCGSLCVSLCGCLFTGGTGVGTSLDQKCLFPHLTKSKLLSTNIWSQTVGYSPSGATEVCFSPGGVPNFAQLQHLPSNFGLPRVQHWLLKGKLRKPFGLYLKARNPERLVRTCISGGSAAFGKKTS